MLRAGSCAALLVVTAACAHMTERAELTTAWRARPGSQFFLTGEAKPDLAVPPGLVAVVLASIRGGLGELGHAAQTGFATVAQAREAAAVAGCDELCVIVDVQLVGLSTGGNFVARKLITGAGDMHVELQATLSDRSGNTLATAHLVGLPFEGGSAAQLVAHVVPTIGPAFAEGISEED